MTRVVRVLGLAVVWLALWSEVSFANVVSGLLVAGAVVLAFDTWRAAPVVIRPVAAVVFALYFVVQLVRSTLAVARTVVRPGGRVHTGIVAVPLRGCGDAVTTVIADAISLTPGTLTLVVRPEPLTLYVHALDVSDVDAVRREVRRLEVLAVRAFGDDEALAGLAVDDTSAWRTR